MPNFSLQFPPEDVPELASRYSFRKDDRPCLAAGAAARKRGYYARDELVRVCEWKTERKKGLVALNTDEDVEFITAEALRAPDERTRMSTMRWLNGVEIPTASALLFFVFPRAYPIIDKRALASLGQQAPRYYSLKYWTEYLDACRALADRLHVPIRTLDKALWQASAEGIVEG